MTSLTLPPTTPLDAQPQHAAQRRTWMLATGAVGAAGVLATAVPFVSSFAPSERAKALGASVEVDIGDLLPGQTKTVEWRGKPVWITRRSPEMLAALQGQEAQLADPQSQREQQPGYAQNATRSRTPEVFVAVGICTHLGCSPTAVPRGSNNPSLDAGWAGGFFCPCHGSTFDGAGRVFKNKPAPTNLEIPPHYFADANRVVIGADTEADAA